jgi:hypothetical protein
MVYRLCLAFILICCSGCVTTTKSTMFCNKTIDLDQRPMDGSVDVGVRLEFFRDWTR